MKDTRRLSLRLDHDAADLLDRLAPSENKRGAYVSELVRRAAVERGLVEPGAAPPAPADLAVVRQELARLTARVDEAIAAATAPGGAK